jgi:glycosyltransferase involved in cell wall biosynthesis
MGDWMGTGRRFVEGIVLKRADAIVVNSEAIARDLVVNAGARRKGIRVIPNGVDLTLFHPRGEGEGGLRAEIWGEQAPECVGAVMSLTSKKNPAMLLEAARVVVAARPAARFLIAGEGPLRAQLETSVAAAGLRGRFRLVGLRRDVPDLLRSIDLLALPSDREGLPNVVLEAMACGLPVVATAVGGTPEIVREGATGRLAPPRDAGAFARAILDILSTPGEAARMGAEGRRVVVSEYGLDAMVDRTQALYDELLVSRASPARARAAGGR